MITRYEYDNLVSLYPNFMATIWPTFERSWSLEGVRISAENEQILREYQYGRQIPESWFDGDFDSIESGLLHLESMLGVTIDRQEFGDCGRAILPMRQGDFVGFLVLSYSSIESGYRLKFAIGAFV